MRRRLLAFLAVLALAGFYFSGHLDHALYPLGLNVQECARNGLGATFCGTELDEYRARVQRPVEEAKERLRRIQEGAP